MIQSPIVKICLAAALAAWSLSLQASPNLTEQPLPDGEPRNQLEFLASEIELADYVRGTMANPEAFVPPLIVPAADFRADSQVSTYYYTFSGGYFGSGFAQDSSGCFMAPVYLPHGAVIGSFFAYLYDNSTDTDFISFSLRRKNNLDLSASQIMATLSTTGASSEVRVLGTESIIQPNVSPDHSYFLTTCMGDGGNRLRIYGAAIFYTFP